MLTYIVPFIILILVVVFIHEYGHYYFARKYGVGVTDFSIGFGKEILDIKFTSPVTDHKASDNCGVEILGEEEKNFWKDRKGANINSIRTKKSIKDSDVIIVKFGEKYKQWNAAFDAGYASALNKSIIVIQNEDHQHALKEIDAAASAVAKDQMLSLIHI